jgi:hypothetical protein
MRLLSHALYDAATVVNIDDHPQHEEKDDVGDLLTKESFSDFQLQTIPEPATVGMVALFGGALMLIRRKMAS